MYYRVAIHGNALSTWQWKSTVLSSLETVVQFLRRYGAGRLDMLRVFSSSERVGLQEQLVEENQGLSSPSITAAHFLHRRLIHFPEMTQAMPARAGGANLQVGVATHPSVQICSMEGSGLVKGGKTALECRRLELELGPGGDHDVSYHFILPAELLQVLAWVRLLARKERGELQP